MPTEMITIRDGEPLLNPIIAMQIADFEQQAKKIKDAEEKLKAAILAEMEAKGIIKVDTDVLSISYIAPTERETLNTKLLREECPEVFDSYVEFRPVKASVRIKVKSDGQ